MLSRTRTQAAARSGILAIVAFFLAPHAAAADAPRDPIGLARDATWSEDQWSFDGDLDDLFAEDPGPDYGRVSMTLGAEYSRGDFGALEPTEGWSFPIGLRYEWQAITLRAATSVLSIRGPQVVIAGNDAAQLPIAQRIDTGRRTETGMGDLVLGVAVAPVLIPGLTKTLSGWPFFEIGFDLKIPTADEKRLLGTGRFDYTLRFDLAKRFGFITPFATGGHTFAPGRLEVAGFLPTDRIVLELRNTWFASAGFVVELPGGLVDFGASYDFRQSSIRGGRDAHEIVPYLSIDTRYATVGPYCGVGLSQGSADFFAGFQLRFSHDLGRGGD